MHDGPPKSNDQSAGPHPDIIDIAIASLQRIGRHETVRRDQFELRKQRTIRDLPNTIVESAETESWSVAIAIVRTVDGKDFYAPWHARLPEASDGAWEWAGTDFQPVSEPPLMPWQGSLIINPKEGLTVGAFVTHPDVAVQEAALPNNEVFQDSVVAECVLTYVPLRTPDLWSGEANVKMRDDLGRPIESVRVPLMVTPDSIQNMTHG